MRHDAVSGEDAMKLGLSIHPQEASWAETIDVVRCADSLGYDSVWAWDHLLGIGRAGRQNVFESWTTIAAWAASTSRVTLGLLVSANTFRHPGLVAKSAVTVDHISDGRFVLGIGAAYRELEHQVHGIDFGNSPGERLTWLEESVAAIRQLLAGEVVTSVEGGHYRFAGASHLPLPVRGPGRLPILIPGAGERRSMRILARFGDSWHVRGSVESLIQKLDLLRAYCRQEGRSLDDVELITGNPVVIRDDPAEAEAVYDEIVRRNGQSRDGTTSERPAGVPVFGTPETVAAVWRPYIELGFRHMVVDLAAPYDRETVERLPEVRAILAR